MSSVVDDKTSIEECRVALVVSQKLRLSKILELLLTQPDLRIKERDDVSVSVLPCVATFQSYSNDKGETIDYLASVDYFPDTSNQNDLPSTLLEVFDRNHAEAQSYPPISGLAIGGGIEGEKRSQMVMNYFLAMRGEQLSSPGRPIVELAVATAQPNEGFASMQEELAHFKSLGKEEKEEALQSRALGPAKMAKLVSDLIQSILGDEKGNSKSKNISETADDLPQDEKVEGKPSDSSEVAMAIDLDEDRFSCRMCRTVLFGARHMEDPPHEPSQHNFSYRKHGTGKGTCQSYFLRDAMEWMRNTSSTESRIHCPKCNSKVGTLHWSGAQCSCGTWVVPAIQIPKSKVDWVSPPHSNPSSIGGGPPRALVDPRVGVD